MGAAAHVHMVGINDLGGMMPGGMPGMPPPGAFQHMAGLPVGVQVAVAPVGMDGPVPLPGGIPGGIAQALMQAGAFAVPPAGATHRDDAATEEEHDMEIED